MRAHHPGVLARVPAWFLGVFWGWSGGAEERSSARCARPGITNGFPEGAGHPSLLPVLKVQAAKAGRRSSLRGLKKPSVK